jgi:putative nucleotidyltransferase with HDIG domain
VTISANKIGKALSRERLLSLWVVALVLGAIALCGSLVAGGYRLHQPIALAVLALLALVAEHQGISLTPNAEVSAVSLVCVFAAVVLGPLSGAVVAAAAVLVELPRRDVAQPILRWSAWTSSRVISTVAAGLTAAAVLSVSSAGFWSLFEAVTAAFVAETMTDIVFASIIALLRVAKTLGSILRSYASALAFSLPLHVSVVAILAYSYESVSPWSVALFAVPAFAAQRLLLLYRQQRETADALGDANARLASANLSFATALVATLDARDRYTAGHSTAVAIYARDIAQRIGLSQDEQDLVHLCGLVHDVGKIGLPAGLLEKPGALSLEERRQMAQHSVIGEQILRKVDDYGEIAEIVRHHHERIDGQGYPDGLVAEEIPLLSRIIAVADAYNAMTSDRPYRDAMPSRVARLRLAQAVETQFDTSVVVAFEAVLASASEDYRLASEPEFKDYSQVSVPAPEDTFTSSASLLAVKIGSPAIAS